MFPLHPAKPFEILRFPTIISLGRAMINRLLAASSGAETAGKTASKKRPFK
jgi:hypothetical protein